MTSPSRKLGVTLSLIGWLAACSTTNAVPAIVLREQIAGHQ